MKKFILFLVLIFLLAGCSEDRITPTERFDEFAKLWEEGKFADLYSFFSSDAKSEYPKEESIERLEKIYHDLDIHDVEITYEKLSEEDVDAAFEKGKATVPFQVKMETMAGPITFVYHAPMQLEGEEEETQNWYVQWDPGFIFPDLKDGGKINITTVQPERGEILDRNQMPLALNDIIYEVGVVPEKMSDSSKGKLSELLGMSEEKIDSALNASWVQPDYFVPLKKVISNELVNQLLQVDGVMVNETEGRIYPEGEAAAHLVGYLRQVTAEDLEKDEEGKYSPNDMIGARGLEQLFDDVLRGEQGVKITIAKEDGEEIILAEKPVKHGEDVMVTIDVNIQEKIFNAYEGDAGTAAAIDPKTGETLALVSSPAFDPNEIMYGTDANIWKRLEEDEQLPLINRFASTFIPGSIIKPITAAIGLKNGTLDPDEGRTIEGLTWSKGDEWGDYKVTRVSTSSGPVDLTDALARSDNIYFAMEALEIGPKAFTDGLTEFGFGEEMPFEYPIAASSIANEGSIKDEILLSDSSFGQGELQVSALHAAMMYTAFLNDGNMLKPTILTSEETGQVWKENLMTKDQAKLIQEGLRAVVTDGTARGAKNADFPISAKTGTAELKQKEDEAGAENSWMVAYPTEDQDIMLAMMIENTHEKEAGYIVTKTTEILEEVKK